MISLAEPYLCSTKLSFDCRPPATSQILRNRGDAYLSLGNHERAIDDYETALDVMEENEGSEIDGMSDERAKDTRSGLLNNLAWVLATSPEDSLRDGQRSIELATEACEMTDYKEAFILSTLASGYAETGDFESAKKWAAKAVELSESDEQRAGIQDELENYKKSEPWREIENVEEEKAKQAEEAGDGKKADDGSESEAADADADADADSESDDSKAADEKPDNDSDNDKG